MAKNKTYKKTECPVSRSEFNEHAKALQVVINGVPLLAEVKQFSTGSFGWFLNGKMTVPVNGVPVNVQIGLNLTAVGSKDLAKAA